MTAYQLPSPPTQQPVSQLPYNEMAKLNSNNQISTPKEGLINKLPEVSSVTTNGQPIQVNSKAAVSGALLTVAKKKSGLLFNQSLKIDTSVASKNTPISPTSQSNSPLPTSTSATTTTTTTTSTNNSPRPKSSNNNTFVHKLYQMLSDPNHSSYINWNDTGLSFTIRNVKVFSRVVLPNHFRHNNFSSFVRQLNMYGFHKVNKSSPNTKGSENQVWEFYHPKFIRGKPHLIEEIKRKQIENETYRANILLEHNRALARHNPAYSINRNSGNINNATTTAAVTVASQLVPSQGLSVNPQITTTDVTGQQTVLIQSPEGIPASNVTVAVTTSGEAVLIDPTTMQNTTQNMASYGVIQIPTQNIPYNDVTVTTPVTGTPIPHAMTLGEVIPQNQSMVDPANVVVSGHPIVPSEVPSINQVPMDNDVLYNYSNYNLQLQIQDLNQRLNDLQGIMNTYSRRVDMQQNFIQQIMKGQGNVSVEQGQAIAASTYDVNNQVMTQNAIVNGNIVTQSPIAHHQIIQQSPIVMHQNSFSQQQPTASPEQKLMNQSHTNTPLIKHESIINNQITSSVGYPTQTLYY